ncbi:MAG: hypothetical protein ACREIV_15470, partial [Planctomycetaceae bacterium]
AYAEQRVAAGQAEARQILDEAATYRQQTVQTARGEAESFEKLIAQLRSEEAQGLHSYDEARKMALRRRYVDAMREVLRQVDGKVLLDSGKPVDLTIFLESQP